MQPRDVRVHEGRMRIPPSGPACGSLTEPSAQDRRARGRRDGDGEDSGRSGASWVRSPDGQWEASVKDHNVTIRGAGKTEETRLRTDGKEGLAYGRLSWAPDSKTLVAFRIEPGDAKEVFLIQSSPPGGGRARLQKRPYPLPGDKFTAYELNLFDVASRKQTKPAVERIDFGSPRLRWDKDGHHFTYQKTDRGHQRFRLIEVDTHTGSTRDIIDEKSSTFIWTAHAENVRLSMVNWLEKSNEIIYVSERDGWRHLYLIDAKTGAVKNPITAGSVRGARHRSHRRRRSPGLVSRRRQESRSGSLFRSLLSRRLRWQQPGGADGGGRQPHAPVFSRSPLLDRYV